jgi:hypothetical protein
MAQTRKNDPHEAGQEAKDAMADAVETGREVANETTRKVADKAEEMTSRGKEAARKGTEAVADDTKEMMSETRGMAEDGAELGLGWLAFWTEQTADGFRTMLQLTTCRSWKQAADIQAGFMRASIERFGNFTSQHAGRATEMAANDLRLAEQKGRSNVERLSRRAS